MKQPLNYAILKYFAEQEEGDVAAVMAALTQVYGRYRTFTRPGVTEALMTAKENGILEEAHTELDGAEALTVWYRVTPYGEALIRKYL